MTTIDETTELDAAVAAISARYTLASPLERAAMIAAVSASHDHKGRDCTWSISWREHFDDGTVVVHHVPGQGMLDLLLPPEAMPPLGRLKV